MDAVPRSAAALLRPLLPSLSEEIIGAIGREVPEYARPLEGRFGRNLRLGVERALARFLSEIERPDAPAGSQRELYVELGRGEFRDGRSLDALLSAYRIGARLAWRRFAEAATAGGLDQQALVALGEAIFAYIDGISAESVEGYASEQSAAAGERDRRRRALVRLLVQDPPADEAAVTAAAEQAGWAPPITLAVLIAQGEDPGAISRALGADALAVSLEGRIVALIGDPSGPRRRAQLAVALDGAPAALGPEVAPNAARRSFERAELAWRLLAAGRLGGDSPLDADAHLPELLLAQDRELSADLARRALAPLDDLKPAQRERLLPTLRSWLDLGGRVEEVARALDVHPQTVRYRMRQLRGLFGASLDDPERRFELALALRT